eukprot:15485092-Alexandrium_andersonii.AAC.1
MQLGARVHAIRRSELESNAIRRSRAKRASERGNDAIRGTTRKSMNPNPGGLGRSPTGIQVEQCGDNSIRSTASEVP